MGAERNFYPGEAFVVPETWWWLSFCDATKPAGTQFLGVAVVRGLGLGDAIAAAHEKGINPGGEVMGMSWEGQVERRMGELLREYSNRLLSKADCAEFEARGRGIRKETDNGR